MTQRNVIIGGFQVLIRPKPYIGNIGYIFKGPLLFQEKPVLIDILYSTLNKIIQKHRIRFLIIQPPDNDEILSSFFSKPGLRDFYPKILTLSSTIIDLKRNLNDILKSMRRTKRQNINKGLKKGIIVREGCKEDINILFQFMLETCKRQNAEPRPSNKEYFEIAWDLLYPLGHLKLFITEYNGESISALLNICFRGGCISLEVWVVRELH